VKHAFISFLLLFHNTSATTSDKTASCSVIAAVLTAAPVVVVIVGNVTTYLVVVYEGNAPPAVVLAGELPAFPVVWVPLVVTSLQIAGNALQLSFDVNQRGLYNAGLFKHADA